MALKEWERLDKLSRSEQEDPPPLVPLRDSEGNLNPMRLVQNLKRLFMLWGL